MRVAYVAGKYRGKSAWEIENNVRRAEEVALELWKMGFAVVCPHANTRFFQGAAPDEVWLAGDMEIMRRCDFVVLVPGWQESRGTMAEIAEAKEAEMPVYEWPFAPGALCEN